MTRSVFGSGLVADVFENLDTVLVVVVVAGLVLAAFGWALGGRRR